MEYEIETTKAFDKWSGWIKDKKVKARKKGILHFESKYKDLVNESK